MTTATGASQSDHRRPRLATALEIAMVVVGVVIGAYFFTSIWSERAGKQLEAAFAPAAPSRSS